MGDRCSQLQRGFSPLALPTSHSLKVSPGFISSLEEPSLALSDAYEGPLSVLLFLLLLGGCRFRGGISRQYEIQVCWSFHSSALMIFLYDFLGNSFYGELCIYMMTLLILITQLTSMAIDLAQDSHGTQSLVLKSLLNLAFPTLLVQVRMPNLVVEI